MKRIKDFIQKSKHFTIVLYRRLFLKGGKYGTIYYEENNKIIRDEVVISCCVSYNDCKPVVGTYTCWINKEEVPFYGY